MWLAYKYVAVAVMLAEANYCAERLKLPLKLPIEQSDLRLEMIAPPELVRFDMVGGRLDTDEYSFCFPMKERLQFVHRIRRFAGLSPSERSRLLSQSKSMITAKEAYRLATNWLCAMSVDLSRLERTNTCEIWQETNWTESGHSKGLLPLYHVDWGPQLHRTLEVFIDGRDRSLLHVRVEDDSLLQRPPELIKGREKLLAISDDDFRSMTAAQRRDLVLSHTAASYPPGILELVASMDPGLPATPDRKANPIGQGNTAYNKLSAAPPGDSASHEFHFKPGDTLAVNFYEDPPKTWRHIDFIGTIRGDGTVVLGSNQVFTAAGKTREALGWEIQSRYVPKFFASANVKIFLTDTPTYLVSGEVNSPGAGFLEEPRTVLKAIEMAGGFTARANQKKVTITHFPDRTKVVVNCIAAQKNTELDLQVRGNDYIIVPK